MLIVAAITWVVTILVSLTILVVNYNNQMLIEDNSQADGSSGIIHLVSYYSEWMLGSCGFKAVLSEKELSTLQSYIDTANCSIGELGNKIMYSYYVLKDGLEKSETIAVVGQYLTMTTDFIITAIHYYDSLDTEYKKIIYSFIFSLCLLFILLNQREVLTSIITESDNEDGQTRVHSDPRDSDREGSHDVATDTSPGRHRNPLETEVGPVSVIRAIYNRLYHVLDESSFFSTRPHVMSHYTVVGSPTLSDITRIVDAMQPSLVDGVSNVTFLSQEYLNISSKLQNMEDQLKSVDTAIGGTIENEGEVLALLSAKDIQIAELKDKIEQLRKDTDTFDNESIVLRSETGAIGTQLKKQKSLNRRTFQFHEISLQEAEGIQQSLSDDLEAEKDLNKSVTEEYSQNIQSVLNMLVEQAKRGKLSFQCIFEFMLSDIFAKFLKVGGYSKELEGDKVLKDYPEERDMYNEHLRILKNQY